MSLENQVRAVIEAVEKREQLRYAFLRHLLVIASGALTLLVSLGSDSRSASSNLAHWSLVAAWPLLGLGILALAVALAGEVVGADRLVSQWKEQIQRSPGDHMPVVAATPKLYVVAEKIAYAALALAVVALVIHGGSR